MRIIQKKIKTNYTIIIPEKEYLIVGYFEYNHNEYYSNGIKYFKIFHHAFITRQSSL